MSGTSAKGKGRGRVKRQEVESEDGWRVITHGLAKMNVDDKDNKKNKKKKPAREISGQLPSSIVKDLTAEKLVTEFERLQERWKEAGIARQIDALEPGEVKEAVCIGIGSFSRDWEHRWRSLWQLVLFVHGASKSSSVRMYAQDPAFTTLDIAFLGALNIEVVDTGIETHISRETFVFSPFVDWFILLPLFMNGRDPVLYIGNEVLDDYIAYANSDEKKGKVGECNELGKKFLRGREMVKLKEFEHHAHAFNGMVVYTKPAT
jgi:hypothetical protein